MIEIHKHTFNTRKDRIIGKVAKGFARGHLERLNATVSNGFFYGREVPIIEELTEKENELASLQEKINEEFKERPEIKTILTDNLQTIHMVIKEMQVNMVERYPIPIVPIRPKQDGDN